MGKRGAWGREVSFGCIIIEQSTVLRIQKSRQQAALDKLVSKDKDLSSMPGFLDKTGVGMPEPQQVSSTKTGALVGK